MPSTGVDTARNFFLGGTAATEHLTNCKLKIAIKYLFIDPLVFCVCFVCVSFRSVN
jgi:hypothetical protein